MDKQEQNELLQERANSLATILLTRRSDVYLSSPPKSSPLSMLADILKQGQKVERQFGVKVLGTMGKPTSARLLSTAKPALDALQAADLSIPVVLLLFNMPADDGQLYWVVEPAIEGDRAHLVKHQNLLPFPLTTTLVNDIVTRIDLWYDAKGSPSSVRVTDRSLSGREALDYIIDKQTEFISTHHKPPTSMRLPLLLAYDLAKLRSSDIGDLSQRVFREGVKVFEKVGLLGMKVKIENDLNDVVLK